LTSSLISLSTGKVLLAPHPSLTVNELNAMGEVTDIAVLDLFHHLGIQKAVAAHPQGKRKDIAWTAFLEDGAWSHQQEWAVVQLRGMPSINECLFVHKPSQTLFVTDYASTFWTARIWEPFNAR
jgi:hypothetical protein